jgi:V/A-type H+-transporting ATPase subunit K
MKILTSLIRWLRAGNTVIATLAMMAIITVAVWMMLFSGSGRAAAEEADGTGANLAEGKAPESAWALGFIAAAISVSVSAIAGGIAVSIVGSAAMGAVAEKPEVMGRSIIFVGLAEGIAIYGLIISIMILSKLQ